MTDVTKVDNSNNVSAPFNVSADAEIHISQLRNIRNGEVRSHEDERVTSFSWFSNRLSVNFFGDKADKAVVLKSITDFITDVNSANWNMDE